MNANHYKRKATFISLKKLIEKTELKHFTLAELFTTLSDNHEAYYIPPHLIDNLITPLLIVDMMREDLGIPIKLTSTYRDPIHNKEEGGVKKSLHLEALAVDFEPATTTKYWKLHLSRMQYWLKDTKIAVIYNGTKVTNKDLGIGLYKTFCHLDARGVIGRHSPVTWKGSK